MIYLTRPRKRLRKMARVRKTTKIVMLKRVMVVKVMMVLKMMVVMPMLRNNNHKKDSSSDFWGINFGLSENKKWLWSKPTNMAAP